MSKKKSPQWNGLNRKYRYGLSQVPGLRDDKVAYESMLMQVVGKPSVGDCSSGELYKLILHLERAHGVNFERKPSKKDKHGEPRNLRKRRDSKSDLMSKIEALLSEIGRLSGKHVPWSYAGAILKQMRGPDRLEWAKPRQLRAVIAALDKRLKKLEREQLWEAMEVPQQ